MHKVLGSDLPVIEHETRLQELLEQFFGHRLDRTLPRDHAETEKSGLLILRSTEHREDSRGAAKSEDLLLAIVHHQAIELARFGIGGKTAAQFRIGRLEYRGRVLHMNHGIALEGRFRLSPKVHGADFLPLKVGIQSQQAQDLRRDTTDGGQETKGSWMRLVGYCQLGRVNSAKPGLLKVPDQTTAPLVATAVA